MSDASGIDSLTTRQREVLALVAKGFTNDEIGGMLDISLTTVRTHVTAILARLDVTNRTEAAWKFHAMEVAASSVVAVLDRPAIAVLPLTPLDDDARARAVAGAISRDLAALFASSCWFPVISHASSAQARALGPTSRHIARGLGARFLVEGSLRMGGDRWRLAIQIDDAELDQCIWTGHHDFPESALFTVQDDICAAIVATAYPLLVRRVQLGLRRLPRPASPAAWERAHLAMDLWARREQLAAAEARSQFVLALAHDPTLVLAHYGQGLIAYDHLLNQWCPDEVARDRLFDAATACLELAPHAGEGYFLHARYFQTCGDHASAVRMLELAISHNPSFSHAHALLAQTLQITGHPDEALARMKHARRLCPRAFVAGLAVLHFLRAEYNHALAAAESAIALNPRYIFARAVAAASAYTLHDHTRANEHASRIRSEHASFSLDRMLRSFGPEVEGVRRLTVALEALGIRP